MRSITLAMVMLVITVPDALIRDHPAVRLRTVARDSIEVRRRLERDAELFLIAARDAWTEVAERASPSRRLANVHCHFDGSFNGRREGVRSALGKPMGLLRSAFTSFSICPDWQPSSSLSDVDESNRPDASLTPPSRQRIVTARLALLASLDSAAEQLPGDRWIIGQRVRFRVDGGDIDGALRVASSCFVDTAWCLTLDAYVSYRAGNVVRADSLFVRALAEAPDSVRCDWGTVQPLLRRDDANKYERLSCAQRDSVNRAAFWLSDPLWSEPGNERRAEQLARQVRAELTFALSRNERWDLRERHGGDAIRAMFLRYGWPTTSEYGGQDSDEAHSSWLGPNATAPYFAPEYSRDRVSSMPTFDAMLAPLKVQDRDFALDAPRGDVMTWWPTEHFRRQGGLVAALPPGQTVLLRRDGGVLFAVATKLSASELEKEYGQRVTASLVVSPRADNVTIVGTQSATLGGAVLVRGRLGTGPTLAGVEVQTTRGTLIGARSRFGVVAPRALTDMTANETAVSDPVLFDTRAQDAKGQAEMADPFDVMYHTLQFVNPKRVGVFWESYGFAAGDSVSVTVRLERVTPVSRFRRLGVAVRVTADPNGAVTASWTEPQPGRSATRIAASIPVLARHISLDVSALQAGKWRLRVAMHRPREPDVSAERLFEVRR